MDIHLLPLLQYVPTILWELIIILLLGGLYLLLLRALKISWNMKNHTSEAQQLVYLSTSFTALMAGALWIVAQATAQFTPNGGTLFLGLGIVYLIFGLRARQDSSR